VEFAGAGFEAPLDGLAAKLAEAASELRSAVAFVKGRNDPKYIDYHARRLVDVATDIYIGYLFLDEARQDDTRNIVARKFINDLAPRARMLCAIATDGDTTITDNYQALLRDKAQ
jgi:hypothetical protein